jgi:hypothetical protein
MSRSRVLNFPRRELPFWKLDPQTRIARGMCPFCGVPGASETHLVFGCASTAKR